MEELKVQCIWPCVHYVPHCELHKSALFCLCSIFRHFWASQCTRYGQIKTTHCIIMSPWCWIVTITHTWPWNQPSLTVARPYDGSQLHLLPQVKFHFWCDNRGEELCSWQLSEEANLTLELLLAALKHRGRWHPCAVGRQKLGTRVWLRGWGRFIKEITIWDTILKDKRGMITKYMLEYRVFHESVRQDNYVHQYHKI